MKSVSARALVAESSAPIANALKLFLAGAGYEVSLATLPDEAFAQATKSEPAVVFASVSDSFDGETLCKNLKLRKPLLPVVLVFAPDETTASERGTAAGADGWLQGPLKKAAVVSSMRSMVKLRELVLKVQSLENEVRRAKQLADANKPATGTHGHDAAFFKKLLLLEIRRSRRYKYPLAFLLVGLDGLAERLLVAAAPGLRATIRAEVLAAMSEKLRDVDLVVPFNDDRYLVFLPHTGREGAATVSGRLVAKLSHLKVLEGTASAGVAVFDPRNGLQDAIGFAVLMREATASLKKAQDAGGARVEIGSSAAAPHKRNRISIG